MTGTATVTIPAEYGEAFRDAVLIEIRGDGERVAEAVGEEQRFLFAGRKPGPNDIDGAVRLLSESHALLAPALAGENEVTGTTEVLQHALGTMADKVLAPKLAEETNTSPVDAEVAAKVRKLTDAIAWAVDQSAAMEARWQAEREEAKA